MVQRSPQKFRALDVFLWGEVADIPGCKSRTPRSADFQRKTRRLALYPIMPAGRRKVAKSNKNGRGGRPSAAASAETKRIVVAAFERLMSANTIQRKFGEKRRAVTARMVLRELDSHRGCANRYRFRSTLSLPKESSVNRVLASAGKTSRFRPINRRHDSIQNHDDGKGPSRFSQ